MKDKIKITVISADSETEFGRGFVYNLVLFAKHFYMWRAEILNGYNPYWYNGASDHLFDLKIPKALKKTVLGERIIKFRNRIIRKGHGSGMIKPINISEIEKDFNELEDICMGIDDWLGVKADRATYN